MTEKLNIWKIDYLSYGTDLLTDFSETQLSTAHKYLSNRFYSSVAVCDACIIQAERRIKTLPKLAIRVNKEYLDIVDVLPVDAKVQRIDFCINVKKFSTAKRFLINQNADLYYWSKTGETLYFGDRKGVIFERIYYLKERKCWRYELEFKPREGRKHKIFNKAHPQIVKMWNSVCMMRKDVGRECPSELSPVTKSRRYWIDVHLESPFVPADWVFIASLDYYERQYFYARLKHLANEERRKSWEFIFTLSNQNQNEN